MALATASARSANERAFDDYYTVTEASLASHRGVDRIRHAMRTGKLRFTWVKGQRLIPREALAEWVGAPAGGDAA